MYKSRGARLALVGCAFIGAYLWQSGKLFPKERQISWQLGRGRDALKTVDVQLYDAEGELLKRETWNFDPAVKPVPPSLLQTVKLREGKYRSLVYFGRTDGESSVRSPDVTVEAEADISVRLDMGTGSGSSESLTPP